MASEKTPATPDATGPIPDEGSGERPKRADLAELRLFRMALAQSWVVPAALKEKAVGRMRGILEDEEAGARSHVAAVRTLLGMTTATTSAITAAVQVHAATELKAELDDLKARIDGKEGQP
jgi:hypothetical protein